MAENTHAKFSFSSAHRWLNCEGTIALSEGLPVRETTPYAKKGTLQHEVNKVALVHFLNYKKVGVVYPCVHTVIDDESCEFALKEAKVLADQYVDLIWSRVLQHAVTGKAYGIEDKVVLDVELDLWGTTDFWAVYINDKAQRTGVIVDFKNGNFVVDVAKNPQLMLYACAFRAEMKSHGKDLDVIRTVIIQPNADCEPYRECSYTSKQLDAFEKKVYKVVQRIVTTKVPAFLVGEWCTFCPALAVCPTYKKSLDARHMLPILTKEKAPDVARLPDSVLVQIALHADDLENFLKAIKAHIIARHAQGLPVAGCKVVERSGKRGWVKNEDLVAGKLKEKGLEPYQAAKLITITEAKKKLTDSELAELTEQGKSSFIIVGPEDSRSLAATSVDLLS